MKRCLLTLLVASVAVVPLKAAEPSVETYKKTYEAELKKIDDECAEGLAKLLGAYEKTIERLMAAAQKKGELATVLKAKEEQERLRREKTVPRDADGVLPASMRTAGTGYHEARDKIEGLRNSRTKALTTKYIAALDRLKFVEPHAGHFPKRLARRPPVHG